MTRISSCRRYAATWWIKFRITTLVRLQYSPNSSGLQKEPDANADMRRKQVWRVVELKHSLRPLLELKVGSRE